MRIAIIDCGTNTFNLLIADVTGSKLKFVLRTKRVVKLGSEGIKDRIIGPNSLERAILAIADYKTIIDKKKVDRIIGVGTAALRDAKNQSSFLKPVQKLLGSQIQLISGNEEHK
jgi:exopolyphosphatase/guanosine-5'-triphosphate,3'-diphosphate pyrophosphatase